MIKEYVMGSSEQQSRRLLQFVDNGYPDALVQLVELYEHTAFHVEGPQSESIEALKGVLKQGKSIILLSNHTGDLDSLAQYKGVIGQLKKDAQGVYQICSHRFFDEYYTSAIPQFESNPDMQRLLQVVYAGHKDDLLLYRHAIRKIAKRNGVTLLPTIQPAYIGKAGRNNITKETFGLQRWLVSNYKQSIRSLLEQSGNVLLIFPEGTRSRTGLLQPNNIFEDEAFNSTRDHVVMAPLAISGVQAMRDKRFSLTKFLAPVKIQFGRIATIDWYKEQSKTRGITTTEFLMREIARNLPRGAERGVYSALLDAEDTANR